MDLFDVVAAAGNISSLIRFSKNTKKREHAEPMDTEEVDTTSTPKRQKVEQEKQMVQVKNSSMKGQVKKSNVKGKQKQEESKKDGLEFQEYVFNGQTLSKYASKEEWLNTYREKADKTFDKMVKLYEKEKQFPKLDVTLKAVRDHVKDTLSLAMNVGDKVSEVNVNLGNIPTRDL